MVSDASGVMGWSDGIHFVRPATLKDRHPMRFVVGAHKPRQRIDKKVSTLSNRHVPTLEEGIAQARAATKQVIKDHPDAARFLKDYVPPVDGGETPSVEPVKRGRGRPRTKPVSIAFSTYHYYCVAANSVAQVWMRLNDMKKPVGRRSTTGRAPRQTMIPHAPGECAVLLIDKPVLDAEGRVRVFKNWMTAEEHANELWATADEEDRFRLGPIVYANETIDVVFNPDYAGAYTPFYLYLRDHYRPVWVNRTKAARPEGVTDTEWEKVKEAHRTPTLESRPQTFPHIMSAIAAAERLVGRNWSPPV